MVSDINYVSLLSLPNTQYFSPINSNAEELAMVSDINSVSLLSLPIAHYFSPINSNA